MFTFNPGFIVIHPLHFFISRFALDPVPDFNLAFPERFPACFCVSQLRCTVLVKNFIDPIDFVLLRSSSTLVKLSFSLSDRHTRCTHVTYIHSTHTHTYTSSYSTTGQPSTLTARTFTTIYSNTSTLHLLIYT